MKESINTMMHSGGRLVAMALAVFAMESACAAAVGEQLTFSSIEAVSSATTQDGASGVSQYYVTIPASADLPAGSKVSLQSIKLARRAATRNYLVLSQAANAAMASTNRVDNDSADANFGSKQWVRYDFNDLELTVGTQYPAYFRDGSGGGATGNGESVYLMQVANISDYQVFAQNSYPSTRIMYYEVKCTVKEVNLPLATPSVDGSNNCTFTITEDSRYEVSSATTYNSITFDVAAGKSLSLSGATLTADNGITVTGDGTVETANASALAGTLNGYGTIAYVGVAPTGLTYSDASWTGTVWLKNVELTGFYTDQYANSGSKVKVSGVTGWIATENASNAELVLDNDVYEFAFKITNANSIDGSHKNRFSVWKKLSGPGTLTANNSTRTPAIKIYDASGFTGSIYTASGSAQHIIIFCGENETFETDWLYNKLYANYKGSIYVSPESSAVTIPSGATWTAYGGFVVDGTLNLAGGTASGPLYGNATVTAASAASSLTVANDSTLTVSAALSGSVTVASGGTVEVASASTAAFTVQSGGTLSTAAEISGAINLTGTMNVYATGTLQLSSGSSVIQQDGVLNVIGGIAHMNVADRGIKGTINIQNGATFKSWGGDRLNYSATAAGGIINVRQGGTLDMDNTRWTMCKYNQINLYEGATITGTGDSNGAALDMNLASGGDDVTIHAIGNATINAPIRSINHNYGVFNVDEGKTLTFSGRLFTNKTTKKGLGTLKLTYANGNTGSGTGASGTSFTVPTLAEGTIEFAGAGNWAVDIGEGRDLAGYVYSGTGSIAVTASQTSAEYGLSQDIVFENVSLASLVPTVSLRNGETATPVLDGTTATIAGSGEIAISGGATMYDATFTNTTAFAYKKTSGANIGLDTALDPKYNNGENDETTGIYLRHHPYVDGAASDINGLTDFTLVVVGQMSPTHKTQFIHIGSTLNSNNGLLIATTENGDEVIIAPNSGKTVDTENAVTVKVPNAASARHAYVIVKSGRTFTVWVDGIRRGNFTVAEGWEIGASGHAGVQVGSDFGGEIQRSSDVGKYAAVANSLDETGVVNVIRIFDYVISDAQAEAIVEAYPYVSAGGLYTRTISADANLSAADAWAKDGEATTCALPEGATEGGVFYNPSATVTVDADAALTVNADLTIDTLTVGGSGTLSVVSDGSHSAGVSGAAVVNSPLSITYGALNLAGTPVRLGSGGTLNFDCSGLDISGIYETTHYPLTGLMDRDDTKVTVTLPTVPTARTASLNYNANGYYELIVAPDREPTNIYYKSGTFAAGSGNLMVVTIDGENNETDTIPLPGDTVVFNDSVAEVSTVNFGATLPDGVGWTFDNWTGTVALPTITAGQTGGLDLNNYGIAGSTVQVTEISGSVWLANAEVVPTVEIADGGQLTLTAFSTSFANTIDKLSGSGAFSLTYNDSAYQSYFFVKDVSEFTGSITVAAPGLAIGGTTKPTSSDWYGKIVVQEPVKVGAGATWQAGGVVLAADDATLTVPSGVTVPTVESGVTGYRVMTEEGENGATVYLLEAVSWPSGWNNGAAPTVAMQTAYDNWVNAGNDSSQPNAEAAFLMGVDVDDYEEPVAEITFENGVPMISSDDTAAVNGVLYVKYGDSPTTVTTPAPLYFEGGKAVLPTGAATARFYKLCIGYAAPPEP